VAPDQLVGKVGIGSGRIEKRDIAFEYLSTPLKLGLGSRKPGLFGPDVVQGQKPARTSQGVHAEIAGDHKA